MPLNYTTPIGPLSRLRDQLALHVRRTVFDRFMREFAPGPYSRVADFGVSGHQEHPVHYFFEELYPFKNRLTAIGRAAEGAGWLSERFPGLAFLEADLRDIPLPDGYFEAGICNAVVEHAGSREDQKALVAEVCRVSRRVMFTTPNKRFPVELHTFLPFLHWLPDRTYRAILHRLGHRYFADVQNLNLLDGDALMSLFPAGRRTRLIRGGLWVSSNLICVSVDERAATDRVWR